MVLCSHDLLTCVYVVSVWCLFVCPSAASVEEDPRADWASVFGGRHADERVSERHAEPAQLGVLRVHRHAAGGTPPCHTPLPLFRANGRARGAGGVELKPESCERTKETKFVYFVRLCGELGFS